MSKGWIRLYRKIEENPYWLEEPFTRGQAWVDLLLLANHKPGWIRVRGVQVRVDRGQVGWSEVSLAKRWKWSRDKVRRFLGELSKKPIQQIRQQKNNVTSLITIINYNDYQGDDTADDTANDTAEKQQTIHEQECKECKEQPPTPHTPSPAPKPKRQKIPTHFGVKEAIEIYTYYLTKIQSLRKSRDRCLKNLQTHSRQYTRDELIACIDNYWETAHKTEPKYRKDPANFFGVNENPFLDYLPGNHQSLEKKYFFCTDCRITASEQEVKNKGGKCPACGESKFLIPK